MAILLREEAHDRSRIYATATTRSCCRERRRIFPLERMQEYHRQLHTRRWRNVDSYDTVTAHFDHAMLIENDLVSPPARM